MHCLYNVVVCLKMFKQVELSPSLINCLGYWRISLSLFNANPAGMFTITFDSFTQHVNT